MIILTRRVDEEIVIDDGRIVVKVCELRSGGLVRIGIEAPGVRVDRREVHEARSQEPRP